MSKSKGNVLDPRDLIDGVDLDTLLAKRTTGLMQDHLKPKIEAATRKQFPEGIKDYGTDALRFTFASLATTGRDIRFDLGRIEGYKNFCNKLWNAARYVLLNTEELNDGEVEFSAADRWIQSRFDKTVEDVHAAFAGYRLDLASQAMYEFTWHEFCDWYLELSKPVLQSDASSDAQKRGTRRTLITTLERLLRLIHPLMPFITEEIWQEVGPRAGISGKTIMLQPYPESSAAERDPEAEAEIAWVMRFILGVRQIRGEMDIPPGKPLPVLMQDASDVDAARAKTHAALLTRVGRVESVRILNAAEDAPNSATALMDDMRLLVPMAGLIDVDAERQRLAKLKTKVDAELQKAEGQACKPELRQERARGRCGTGARASRRVHEAARPDSRTAGKTGRDRLTRRATEDWITLCGGFGELAASIGDHQGSTRPAWEQESCMQRGSNLEQLAIDANRHRTALDDARQSLGTVILGKSEEIGSALACLLARGHLLIEDLAGPRQNHARPGAGIRARAQLPAGPVHQRPVAGGHRRRVRLQSGFRPVRVSARPDLCAAGAGR